MYWRLRSFNSLTCWTTPWSPIHLKAGFLELTAWHFSISPIDCSTLAMSYSLRILVFSFCSFWSSAFSDSDREIFFADSSKVIIDFQVTNRWMNCWHKIPRDFSFLYFFYLQPFWRAICLNNSVSSSSDWISTKLGIAITGSLKARLLLLLMFWFSLLFCGKTFLFWQLSFWKFSLYFYKFKISKIRLVFIIKAQNWFKIWNFAKFMKILSSFWWLLDKNTYYLCLYWVYYAVDSPPLVAILCLSPDDAKALKDIDDIVNPPALYPQLQCALIKEKQILLFLAIYP